MLKGRLREIAKSVVIRSGGLGLYHRGKHREVLTVLMLHRVLPQHLISTYRADQEYTISTTLLEELVTFVTDHYNIVDLEDVLKSQAKTKPLPPYPLLVTFDDGWEDNGSFAADILASANVPWTLFAATDAISSGERWWQEDLLLILRTNNSAFDTLKDAALRISNRTVSELPSEQAFALLLLYGALPEAQRSALIALHSNGSLRQPGTRDMVDWDTLRKMQNHGVSIAGHGASHLPLTLIDDPAGDLQRAQLQLRQNLGPSACTTMSFPHGRYNSEIVKRATSIGTKLMFTSDPVLSKCPGGWLESNLVGRVPISTKAIARSDGTLDPERVMPWLMLRPMN